MAGRPLLDVGCRSSATKLSDTIQLPLTKGIMIVITRRLAMTATVGSIAAAMAIRPTNVCDLVNGEPIHSLNSRVGWRLVRPQPSKPWSIWERCRSSQLRRLDLAPTGLIHVMVPSHSHDGDTSMHIGLIG